jgi:hypothetical protein
MQFAELFFVTPIICNAIIINLNALNLKSIVPIKDIFLVFTKTRNISFRFWRRGRKADFSIRIDKI